MTLNIHCCNHELITELKLRKNRVRNQGTWFVDDYDLKDQRNMKNVDKPAGRFDSLYVVCTRQVNK